MNANSLAQFTANHHPYKARMYRSAAFNIANAFDSVVIPYDTIDYDPASMLTTGAAAKFTAPVSGIWLITFTAQYGYPVVAAATHFATLLTTGTNVSNRHDVGRKAQPNLGGGTTIGEQCATQIRMGAGATAQGAVFQTSGGVVALTVGSVFSYFEVSLLRFI